MNAARAAALACVAGLLQGCVVLPLPQRVVHHPTLTGQVIDADSGRPLAGAIVSLGSAGAEPSATTNANGEFELASRGWRFPYTWARESEDEEPAADFVSVWVTVGERSRQVARIAYYPASFADPGSRNELAAELGRIEF